MEHYQILAVIVTYNPDIDVLKKNIEALSHQTSEVVIYDNRSVNVDAIREISEKYETVKLVLNYDNLGLPVNYNKAIDICIEKGYEWLLTMDQDTIIPEDTIKKYSVFFKDERVAIISPVIRDIKIQTKEEAITAVMTGEMSCEIEECISSAACNRVSVLKKLGGFDEKLFIDQVDFDYCRNVILHGYKIIRVNNCVVNHQIGDSHIVNVLGRKVVISNHTPIRKYYIFRNKVYFARKYHISVFDQPSYFLTMSKQFIILFKEKESVKKVKLACKGILDGLKL